MSNSLKLSSENFVLSEAIERFNSMNGGLSVADHIHNCVTMSDRYPSFHDENERAPVLTSVQQQTIETLKRFWEAGGPDESVFTLSRCSPYAAILAERMRRDLEHTNIAMLYDAPPRGTPSGRRASETVVWDIESYDPRERTPSGFETLYGWTGERKMRSTFLSDFHPADFDFPTAVIAPTGRAAKIINEKLGKQAAEPSPRIDVPKDFKPKTNKPNNRAERRRAGRKERDHAERHIPR